MLYIVAGSIHQAKSYTRRKGIPPSRWRYVYDKHSLAGIVKETVLLIGTWRQKHNSDHMVEYILSRRCWFIEDDF
jgi:hypothetical protein